MRSAQKPDLFVLDVDSVYDSAQEFIYDLRTSHPKARAIILTASHFTAQREAVAGLGAMHFLEKPFPRNDFITLVEALLAPAGSQEGERFQGTLSDLHIADIIQLKCISGATSMLEFTGPKGEKARVYFENGQVRHASAPGKEGRDAFNQIVDWKGGVISEVPVPEQTPRTITLDWQVLLMEAVRNIDETRGAEPGKAGGVAGEQAAAQTILVIDDSLMLLSFVKEILTERALPRSHRADGGRRFARMPHEHAGVDPARLRAARHEGRRSLPQTHRRPDDVEDPGGLHVGLWVAICSRTGARFRMSSAR